MFDQKQLDSLLQRVDSLLVSVESYDNSFEAEDMERQIACAARSAEDVIESHIVDQILPQDMIQSLGDAEDLDIDAVSNIQLEMLDVREIIQDMDSIWEKVTKAGKERGFKVELPAESSTRAVASRPPPAGKSGMVGFDVYSTKLLSKLTGDQPNQQVFPIVGMGGSGKTTLARNAYDSVPVVKHFSVRAWVVISQTFVERDILLETLSCLGQSKHEMIDKTESELRQLLHQTLFNRRYLIVLDDMWSIDAWDMIKLHFPNDCNGSRILVTTRMSEVANHFVSIGLELSFLDEVYSWKLFCEKAFPHEDCPAELENCGKEIVRKCRGLPLAIVVIGGLLGSISRTLDQWENVEKDITSILNTTNDEQCLKLLSLSYTHLPACLKPCFLYLGIFPEDDLIHVSNLIKLWVAEGFVKPNKDQSLEEIAEGYVKNLVDRNLISVHSLRWSGKVKSFRIHDLLRDLCIRVAKKEKFICFTSFHGSTREEEADGTTGESKLITRSIISNQGDQQMHFKSRLLRVLVGVYNESVNTIFLQVNLRFFNLELKRLESPYYNLPSSISLIWNLQTLIINSEVDIGYAPCEIWKMPQLRHLMCPYMTLPEPSHGDGIVLHNLQTLGDVADLEFSEEACKKIPNIKKLLVHHDDDTENGVNFVLFNKLESLKYQFEDGTTREELLQSFFKFPNSLKKLTLECFPLQCEDLRVIGRLPHLEALVIIWSMYWDNWDPAEGEFPRLRFLRIVGSDLKWWNANDTHFPVLENLALERMPYLYEIPLEIGNIQTLQCISVEYCSVSACISAVKIQEEQENFGNKGLQVNIYLYPESANREFMESVELEGLTGVNFKLNDNFV